MALVELRLAAAGAVAYELALGDYWRAPMAGLTMMTANISKELLVAPTRFRGAGTWRISREFVHVSSAPAVELLGATTVRWVDKPGPLTEDWKTSRGP